MPDRLVWKGKSGQEYDFAVFPLPVRSELPHTEGNYIFAKDEDGAWWAVYIGQGYLDDCIARGQSDPCVKSKGATHVCTSVVPGGTGAHLAMVQDLLAGNSEAYAPAGCNMSDEKRAAPRHRTLKGGKIAFDNGNCLIDCTIKDMSEIGAGLKVGAWFDCPARVELRLADGTTHQCKVARHSGLELGVRFIGEDKAKD